MNEELIEQVARALALEDRIQLCSDAIYAQSSYRGKAQAAIAATFAFIREQAAKPDALNAGRCQLDYHMHTSDDEWLTLQGVFSAMLDQIERTE